MSELVREQHGNVLVLRLNRPEARNALSAEILDGLAAGLTEAEADAEIRAVVLTGTGDKAFCAGLDLKTYGGGAIAAPESMALFMRLMAGDIAVPLVGAANASALGGGLEVLLGCDVVVASSEARFGLPEVKRGLFPGGNGTAISQRIPVAVALELLLTGDPISAERAHQVGLVNEVVAPDQVLPAAIALAERIAANAPLSLAAVKELGRMHATGDPATEERLTHWRSVVFASEDGREGMTAFAEKRPPVWKGR